MQSAHKRVGTEERWLSGFAGSSLPWLQNLCLELYIKLEIKSRVKLPDAHIPCTYLHAMLVIGEFV